MGLIQFSRPWEQQPQYLPRINAQIVNVAGARIVLPHGEAVAGAQPTTNRPGRVVTRGGVGIEFTGSTSQKLVYANPVTSGDFTIIAQFVLASTANQLISGVMAPAGYGSNQAHYIAIESNKIMGWSAATSNWTGIGTIAPVAGSLYTVVYSRIAASGARLFVNGAFNASNAFARAAVGLSEFVTGLYTDNGASASPMNGAVTLSAVLPFAANDGLASALSENPWQLFEPRRIWVPQAAITGLPTLSASTYKPGTLTATGWTPRITAS